MNDSLYLLMEKDTSDLATLNATGMRLSEDTLIDATARFTHLLDAQKYFSIANHDIKPANILITGDGRPMVIDISLMFTQGYHGTEGELLARALLENHLKQNLKSERSLERYFNSPKKERDAKIATP